MKEKAFFDVIKDIVPFEYYNEQKTLFSNSNSFINIIRQYIMIQKKYQVELMKEENIIKERRKVFEQEYVVKSNDENESNYGEKNQTIEEYLVGFKVNMGIKINLAKRIRVFGNY